MVNVSIDILDFWRGKWSNAWKVVTFLQWVVVFAATFLPGCLSRSIHPNPWNDRKKPFQELSHRNVLSSMVTCLRLPWWVAFTNSTRQEILVWSPVHSSTDQVCFRTQCYLLSVICKIWSWLWLWFLLFLFGLFLFPILMFLVAVLVRKKEPQITYPAAADPATHHSLLVALPLPASLPRWLVKHNQPGYFDPIEQICSSIWIISAGVNVKKDVWNLHRVTYTHNSRTSIIRLGNSLWTRTYPNPCCIGESASTSLQGAAKEVRSFGTTYDQHKWLQTKTKQSFSGSHSLILRWFWRKSSHSLLTTLNGENFWQSACTTPFILGKTCFSLRMNFSNGKNIESSRVFTNCVNFQLSCCETFQPPRRSLLRSCQEARSKIEQRQQDPDMTFR